MQKAHVNTAEEQQQWLKSCNVMIDLSRALVIVQYGKCRCESVAIGCGNTPNAVTVHGSLIAYIDANAVPRTERGVQEMLTLLGG